MQILRFMEVNLFYQLEWFYQPWQHLGQPRDEMLLSKRKQDQRWNCCEYSSCHCPTEAQVAKLGLEILYTIEQPILLFCIDNTRPDIIIPCKQEGEYCGCYYARSSQWQCDFKENPQRPQPSIVALSHFYTVCGLEISLQHHGAECDAPGCIRKNDSRV